MEKQTNEKMENGITLLVLVITIVILIILAGVTIATLTGDNRDNYKCTKSKNNNRIVFLY